jgi:AcrR family transcriptional regulator
MTDRQSGEGRALPFAAVPQEHRMRMERKPKRRTRERILETSLRLFNDFGEPNVTTTAIAAEMNISPGNLYYHFHSKDHIVNTLFSQFEREIDGVLAVPTARPANVEDVWLFLHLIFESIWRYRFLYRDLNDLLTRNRLLEAHFKRLLTDKVRTATALCQALAAGGQLQTTPRAVPALATNMVVVMTYWLSYEYVLNPRHPNEGETLARGVYHVLTLVAPFLTGEARELFERLAGSYLSP